MVRWKGGHCPKCGRPIAQKADAPVEPCPDCTIASRPPAGPRDASLARLKAIARAEAMEWAAEQAPPNVAPWLKALARDYRQQAEGGE